MQFHLELFKVEPLVGLQLVQVVVDFPRLVAEGVEASHLVQQEDGGRFVQQCAVPDRIISAHETDLVRTVNKCVRIATIGGAKVDSYDNFALSPRGTRVEWNVFQAEGRSSTCFWLS